MANEELSELNADIRELRADNKKLGEKIDAVHTTLRDKMDEGFRVADAKIDALRDKMDEGFRVSDAKIDALRDKMGEGFRISDAKIDSLNEKLTKVSDSLSDMRGLQKALLWVVGGVGSLATVLITAGKVLRWF